MVGKYGLNLKKVVKPFHLHRKVTSEQDTADCSEDACPSQSIDATLPVLYSCGNDYVCLPFIVES